MKKKLLFMGGIAVIILAVITAIIICTNKTENEEGITRYEWIQMLTEQFGKTDYDSETPYYKDVPVDNEYYASVQIARQWKILDDSVKFNGEKNADGEFVVLTAMRGIGKHQIQLYLQMKEEPNDKELLELALQEGLMTKGQLDKNVSKEEAENILSKIEELYLHKFWGDDYAEISYQDKVKELEQDAVLSVNGEGNRITVSNDVITALKNGDIIVYSDPVTGEMLSKKISSIYDESVLELEEVQLDDVVDSLYLSDKVSVSANDVFTYLANEQNVNGEINLLAKNSDKNVALNSEGASISVESDGGDIVIGFTNNDTGVYFETTLVGAGHVQQTISAEVSLSQVDANIDIIYEQGDLKYINAQIDSDITLVGGIETNVVEWEIPLAVLPIPVAGGLVRMDVELILVVNLDGTVSLQVDIPMMFGVNYTQGSGIRTFADAHVNLEIKADCTLSAGIEVGPDIRVLGIDVFQVGGYIGIYGNGERTFRNKSHIISCTELTFAYPIIYFEVKPNELLKEFIDMDLKWNWYDEDTAPHKWNMHYEKYDDGTLERVEECTFNTDTRYIHKPHDDRIPWLGASFDAPFVDCGDYYQTTGKLITEDTIPLQELVSLQVGDVYDFWGHEYIYTGEKVMFDELLTDWDLEEKEQLGFEQLPNEMVYLFTDVDNRNYFVNGNVTTSWIQDENGGSISRDIRDCTFQEYIYEERDDLWGKHTHIDWHFTYSMIDDNYSFILRKEDVSDLKKEVVYSIFTIKENTIYNIALYVNGDVSRAPTPDEEIFSETGTNYSEYKERILHKIDVEWLTLDDAKAWCYAFMMNIVSEMPEEVLEFFDENGDLTFDKGELEELYYWAIDNYNGGDKSEISDNETFAIAYDVENNGVKIPHTLYYVKKK